VQEGRLTKLVDERYSTFNSPLGEAIEVCCPPLEQQNTLSDMGSTLCFVLLMHIIGLLVVLEVLL
jgi:hypothetical protein